MTWDAIVYDGEANGISSNSASIDGCLAEAGKFTHYIFKNMFCVSIVADITVISLIARSERAVYA